MKTRRWLLPFTFELDNCAINCVVRQAESAGATLVAVSLISPPTALVLIRLSPSAARLTSSLHLVTRFLSWWRGLRGSQDLAQEQQEEVFSTEETLCRKKSFL